MSAPARPTDAAITELVTSTRRYVWRLCATLVDPASADDLTQDTYVRAVRSLSGYRGSGTPLSWIATIARRVCAEEIAMRQRARALGAELADRHQVGPADDTALVDLVDAVDRLLPDRRDAFVRTAMAGLTYAETALLSDCPIGTVRSRVARARSDLAEALSA